MPCCCNCDSRCRHVMNKITRGCLSFFLLNVTLPSQTNLTLLTPVSLSDAHLLQRTLLWMSPSRCEVLPSKGPRCTQTQTLYNLLRTQTGESLQRNATLLTQSCRSFSTTGLFILSDSVTTLRTTSCQVKWQFLKVFCPSAKRSLLVGSNRDNSL